MGDMQEKHQAMLLPIFVSRWWMKNGGIIFISEVSDIEPEQKQRGSRITYLMITKMIWDLIHYMFEKTIKGAYKNEKKMVKNI